MTRNTIAVLIAVLGPTALHAQELQRVEDEIQRHLFPPEAVMQHQGELGITPQQRSTIDTLVRALQDEVVDLQWELQSENEKLLGLLRQPRIDVDAAVQQFERVLDAERRIKTIHFRTLIQIRNTLTPAQRDRLREILGTQHSWQGHGPGTER
jgi:Spy/CpxP family protein refolding chaperone